MRATRCVLYVVSGSLLWYKSMMVLPFPIMGHQRAYSPLHLTDEMDADAAIIETNQNTTKIYVIGDEDMQEIESELSCRVLGFYPFPTPLPQGPFGWLLKDTHQAIIVTLSNRSSKLPGSRKKGQIQKTTVLMDFMTKGGATHPVWYDEFVKWNVFLGGSIEGEVRMKMLGKNKRDNEKATTATRQNASDMLVLNGMELGERSSKIGRLMDFANAYDCEMNLYRNNCRMFVARMEREVERINLEDTRDGKDSSTSMMAANFRCELRILGAGILPLLYPMGAIFLLYEGCLNR